jgi:all-trans-retinol dehydrogenase (NAD+)
MTDFKDKHVLITGAASGIGRLLAHKIAARGAHVFLWDVDERALRELGTGLEQLGHKVTAYRCDVTDRVRVRELAERILGKCGALDVLINNAGIVSGKPILEASDDEIRRTFEVNALAHFWTVRAFLPAMAARRRGHIVTIASAGGLVGSPRLTDYCASKFAAVGFDESLRLELRRQKLEIKTTVVCPFFVDTGMFTGVSTRFPWLIPVLEPEYVAERIVRAIERDRRRLIMPRFVYVALPLRILPVRWFDRLVDFFGITRNMDGFRGRNAAAAPPGARGGPARAK